MNGIVIKILDKRINDIENKENINYGAFDEQEKKEKIY